jgi:hypothetical protein
MPTTNYDWDLPVVGGSTDSWGDELNALFEQIDNDVFAVSGVASGALPKAGGTMTGRLDAFTSTTKNVALGAVSGAVVISLAAAQSFSAIISGTTAFAFNNVPAGSFLTGLLLRLTNAGAAVVSFPASVKWPGGVAPTLTAAGTDQLVFITDDNGVTWRGFVSGLDIK